MNWRELYDARDWDGIENWWKSSDDLSELVALLAMLEHDIPRIVIENGMEVREDPISWKDAPDDWKGAVKILSMGELASRVEGDPPTASVEWQTEADRIRALMHNFRETPEVTKGNHLLSRAAHAEIVLDLLDEIELTTKLMLSEIDPSGECEDDRIWLKEVIAQALLPAFNAGAHARAAAGKEFESHAVRGQAVLSGSKKVGRDRATQHERIRRKIVEQMDSSMDKGLTQVAAAKHAFKLGIGTSAEANRTSYKRAKKLGLTRH